MAKLPANMDFSTNPVADPTATLVDQPAGPNDPAAVDALRLGQTISVQVAPGLLLRNNETGTLFAHATPTDQVVTVTTLKRLRDGDLVLL